LESRLPLKILSDMNRNTNALSERWGPELIEQAGEAFRQKTIFAPFPPL